MKKTYISPATTGIGLDAENHFMGASTPPKMSLDDDTSKGFNEGNNRNDWLSNKKSADGFWSE